MGGIIWVIVVGFVAGIIARLLSPGRNNPTGFILTTVLGIAGAFLATFVGQASLVPELPRVLVGLARQHHTWGLVEDSGAFALHLDAAGDLRIVRGDGAHDCLGLLRERWPHGDSGQRQKKLPLPKCRSLHYASLRSR